MGVYNYSGWLKGKNATKRIKAAVEILDIDVVKLSTETEGWLLKKEIVTFAIVAEKRKLQDFIELIWPLGYEGYKTTVTVWDLQIFK